MSTNIRVVLVDDQQLIRVGFRRILETADVRGSARRVYEFFDHRAFRRIDELFDQLAEPGLQPGQ